MEPLTKIADDTIAAISTPHGTGGIAVIRISGPQAVQTVSKAWKGRDLNTLKSHTATLGTYRDIAGDDIDRCVATIFRGPKSFTGDDTVEISVHGSQWIQQHIIKDLIARGIRAANPGEFTQRAFVNGNLDLAQAEGVADLIAASSKAAHSMAMAQTAGRFSAKLDQLRQELIDLAALLELELDFSEEDVTFADRRQLAQIALKIQDQVQRLIKSFKSGNALKNGVNVVIAGIPNAGKSSLLNTLLDDDKAIVSDIPGTTRDIIEDTAEINGILYRFIDTAGLRQTDDRIEKIGIDRAHAKLRQADIILWVYDPTAPRQPQDRELARIKEIAPDTGIIIVESKCDLMKDGHTPCAMPSICISTKTGQGIDRLIDEMTRKSTKGYDPHNESIVTNARHYESLVRSQESLTRLIDGLDNGQLPDLLAQDLREVMHHLGTITGAITTPTLLQTIFSRFCIGK